ncbi:hypothetical protein NE857_21085 [Nocardiopsis exhalans]|uniref:Uncharacterized protein n=1 Tax=Nocardiopsis exhalans TaxID=163604 RepID=A0ABY5D315_9ACTN|nr:hypothetical protein [Nocardiopsis exhalans]USY17815.1 hypothetical protein NE857_21085 [Nocardiopsis exhalans]
MGIYFGTIRRIRGEPILLIPFLATLLVPGVSCLLCLDVIWVHWLTAREMKPDELGVDVREGFMELLLLRGERTRVYRMAWLLSFASAAAVLSGVFFSVFLSA